MLRKLILIILLTAGISLVNYVISFYVFSYDFMLRAFESSEHYRTLIKYRDFWDVPVWVGEFAFSMPSPRTSPLAISGIAWTSIAQLNYVAEQSMIKIMEKEGWGWSHWESEEASFNDENENAILSRYMKGSWKPNDPVPKLVVKGRGIQTEGGMPVVLKGESLPLKYLAFYGKLETDEGTFRKLDEMGMNSIRIIIDLDDLMPMEGDWNEKSFDTLKNALDLAEKHHMYVILDLHQYRGSSYFIDGCGFPPWYVQRSSGFKSENPEDWERFNDMWITKETPYEDSWQIVTEAWKKIINVSKGRNIVAGYDLFNEPPGQAYKFYEYLSAQLEPLDPGKIHFVETMHVFRDMNSGDKPKVNNLALSPHLYDVWDESYTIVIMSSWFSLFIIVIFGAMILIKYR